MNVILLVVFIFFITMALPACTQHQAEFSFANATMHTFSAINGLPVKFLDANEKQIYLFASGVLYPIENPDTLNALGYQWEHVNYIRKSYVEEVINSSTLVFGDRLNLYVDSEKVSYMKNLSTNFDRSSFELPDSYRSMFAEVKFNFMKFRKFIGKSNRRRFPDCAHKNFVSLTENTYGRLGNALIQMKNTLLIAELLNWTTIIPRWFEALYLNVFNENEIKRHLCVITWFEYNQRGYTGYIEHIETKQSLAGTPVWYSDLYQDFNTLLPQFNQASLPIFDGLSLKVS